jgi:hypothetical protein
MWSVRTSVCGGFLALVVSACGSGAASNPPHPGPSTAGAATTPLPVAIVPASTGATSTTNGASRDGPGQPGETLGGLLGPGDFTAAGVPGAGVPTLNGDGFVEAYCDFARTSSATGGIELDAFAGSLADAASTYTTVLGESTGTGQSAKADLSGADDASINLADAGGSATIAVRAGKLVFALGLPKTDAARNQLLVLAHLVLDRAAALR